MPRHIVRRPKPKKSETIAEAARRHTLTALRRAEREEKTILRLTRSAQVLISRRDRALREFAEFILERDGDEFRDARIATNAALVDSRADRDPVQP